MSDTVSLVGYGVHLCTFGRSWSVAFPQHRQLTVQALRRTVGRPFSRSTANLQTTNALSSKGIAALDELLSEGGFLPETVCEWMSPSGSGAVSSLLAGTLASTMTQHPSLRVALFVRRGKFRAEMLALAEVNLSRVMLIHVWHQAEFRTATQQAADLQRDDRGRTTEMSARPNGQGETPSPADAYNALIEDVYPLLLRRDEITGEAARLSEEFLESNVRPEEAVEGFESLVAKLEAIQTEMADITSSRPGLIRLHDAWSAVLRADRLGLEAAVRMVKEDNPEAWQQMRQHGFEADRYIAEVETLRMSYMRKHYLVDNPDVGSGTD